MSSSDNQDEDACSNSYVDVPDTEVLVPKKGLKKARKLKKNFSANHPEANHDLIVKDVDSSVSNSEKIKQPEITNGEASFTPQKIDNVTDRLHDSKMLGSNMFENNLQLTCNEVTSKIQNNVRNKRQNSPCISLDYDANENQLHQKENERLYFGKGFHSLELQRWIICMLIGIATGLTAVMINLCIILISDYKKQLIGSFIKNCVRERCLYEPMLIWITFNVGIVLVASLLTVFLAPVAAGSGIPQIKCFLNGVKVPGVCRVSAYFTKVVGVIATVCAGLASGKEGPMVHAAAVLAAGISQGRSLTFGLVTRFFEYFRNDREKRDFVCAGAAAGVSAAFGAPVGGVLFSLEEAASFWDQGLTWRNFFCSVLSSYTLNLLMSIYNGHSGELAHPGLINFGRFEGTYEGFELAIFLGMGCLGGIFGAMFVAINYRITVHRMRYIRTSLLQVCECLVVAAVCGCVAFVAMYWSRDCKPLGQDPDAYLQFYCRDGEYNTMSVLFFTTPEEGVKSVFHDPLGSLLPVTIVSFVVPYFFLACWTYGLKVPTGLFVPALLIGACWGRLIGIALNSIFPESTWTQDLSKYALIGAAAQIGGTVRMTISLAVILIEATGTITYSLPLMGVLLVAKWVGDCFNAGIYDTHIHLMKIPLLETDPKPMSKIIEIRDVMNSPAVCLNRVSKVADICSILSDHRCHNAFPIIDQHNDKFRGTVRLYEIILLLSKKVFVETTPKIPDLKLKDFLDTYPRYEPLLANLNITEEEMSYHLDLSSYINPSPYTVYEKSTLSKVYLLFRSLGLRHLVVLDDEHKVVGIVTRSNLWKYGEAHSGFDVSTPGVR